MMKNGKIDAKLIIQRGGEIVEESEFYIGVSMKRDGDGLKTASFANLQGLRLSAFVLIYGRCLLLLRELSKKIPLKDWEVLELLAEEDEGAEVAK